MFLDCLYLICHSNRPVVAVVEGNVSGGGVGLVAACDLVLATENVVFMRLSQEYETIKGFLIVERLADELGLEQLEHAMARVQKKFGDETVDSAFNVSLKVGIPKAKLQKLMFSDHFIEHEMNMKNLGGFMRFLNCPIHGSHQYVNKELGTSMETSQLFCKRFCRAHAQSMFEKFIPFPVAVTQPMRMATDGKCEFRIKIAPTSISPTNEKYVPLVVSWNVTLKCNLKCAHCYINAAETELADELSTDAAKMLIHQITEVSRPLLILSGGEPLMRDDIYEIIRYGADRGLRMGMGSNGMLIDDEATKKLEDAGMGTVAISLDSSIAEHHDDFRGVKGCWQYAVDAITKGLRMDLFDTPIRVSTVDPGLVETEFSLVRFHGDKERAAQTYQGYKPLEGRDIAEAVVWVASRPEHVQVAEVIVLPTAQAGVGLLDKRV